ncbi:hypothetical protein BU15DRAFT_72783 [Melanogaster broomeanus]|nr:hypothetical protein BU15DRAFT_72783 [Melanogaster broomeanus]
MAAQIPALPAVDNTLGALLIGLTVSAVAYGILIMQVFTYYRRYSSDKTVYKALVALLWIMETTHQALLGHCVYYYTITNSTNLEVLLEKPVWSIIVRANDYRRGHWNLGQVLLLTTCLAIQLWQPVAHNFPYDIDLWRNGSRPRVYKTKVQFLQILCAGLQADFAIAQVSSFPESPLLGASGFLLASISLGLGVVNDMAVAAALCFYLQSMRVNYSRVDSKITTLTIYAINTGVLTSAMSFTTLIMYDCMPNNFIFVGCYFVLSKLYAISLLATLNTRKISSDRGQHVRSIPLQVVSGLPTQMPMPTNQEDCDDVEGWQKSNAHKREPNDGSIVIHTTTVVWSTDAM